MRNRLIVIIFVAFGQMLFGGLQANAKPIEVISENFEFYGDTSEKSAIELVESLEYYRAILFTFFNKNTGPELLPVKIYGFKSQGKIEDVTGLANIGGLYLTTLEGPSFMLTTEGGFKRGKTASQIAYHEYTHHVIAGFSDKVYPVWYNEGFADYLSTFEYNERKAQFKMGRPSNSRAWTLSRTDWIPYDIIINSVREYPFKGNAGRGKGTAQAKFYAQSWLAAHYIQSTEKYSTKLAGYIDLLNSPNAPDDAFEKSFGVSIPQFELELKAYHKKNSYTYISAKLNSGLKIPEVKVRKLSKAELKYHYGEAARRMILTKEGRALAKDYFDEAEEKLGQTAQLLSSKALLAHSGGDLKTALELVRAALEKDPESRYVRRAAGIIELEAYQRLGSQSGSVEAAREHLMKAMLAYPDDATAHYYYALSYAGSYDAPSKQAVASAESALGYFRSLNFFQTNVNLAQILDRGGEEDLAVPVYKRVLVWAQSPSIRAFAEEKLKSIEMAGK